MQPIKAFTPTRMRLLAGLLACGCTPVPKGVLTVSAVQADRAAFKSIEVASGDSVSSFDGDAAEDMYEAGSLNTTGNVKIRVTTTDGATASIGAAPLPSGQWVAVTVPQLDRSSAIKIAIADAHGLQRTYQIASLPADFPHYTVTVNSPLPGTICFAPNTNDGSAPSYLFITDQAGQLLFYKKLPDKGFDFAKHRAPDGAVRYSYFQKEGPQLAGVSGGQGSVRLLDGNYHEIRKLMLLPNGTHAALPTDMHEFVYLGDDHYLLAAVVSKQVTDVPALAGKPSHVAAAVIQEVEAGRVVFEWDSSEHPEFYANATDGNDFTNASQPNADYMHLNSVCIDPSDNNLVVSFRHQDQVVKLDRKTGNVIWRLGGGNSDFALTPDQQFSHQHFARFDGTGALTLFDNGNSLQKTRMLRFTLDQANRQVKSFETIAPESRYSGAMGSFQMLNADTAFVGWGYRVTGDSDAAEWLRGGKQTFRLKFDNPAYENYRSLKYLD